jgi:ABC-type multidrug transport system fused ATPase/permease subunit
LHRLAEEVLVIEAGRVTARGSHADLLQAEGFYARCHDRLAEPTVGN